MSHEAPAAGGRTTHPDELPAMEAAFRYLHHLFRVPSAHQWTWLTSQECGAFWRALGEHVHAADLGADPGLPADIAEYEAQYIAAFEAGVPHPPVPLIESHHNHRDPVPRILQENILFYQAFGLRLRSEANETADHLRHQLEFVARLFEMEAESWAREEDPADPLCPASLSGSVAAREQIRRARREYLERHLLSWLPRAAEIAADAPHPWVRRYLAMSHRVAMVAGGL